MKQNDDDFEESSIWGNCFARKSLSWYYIFSHSSWVSAEKSLLSGQQSRKRHEGRTYYDYRHLVQQLTLRISIVNFHKNGKYRKKQFSNFCTPSLACQQQKKNYQTKKERSKEKRESQRKLKSFLFSFTFFSQQFHSIFKLRAQIHSQYDTKNLIKFHKSFYVVAALCFPFLDNSVSLALNPLSFEGEILRMSAKEMEKSRDCVK